MKETFELAETLDGPIISAIKKIALEKRIWVSLGGFHQKISDDKLSNSHILINENGNIVQIYNKIHLFDAPLVNLEESKYVKAGEKIQKPIVTPIGNVSLGICYDLRFPQFSTTQRINGAHILTYPSAFTVPTGEAHWECLLRARAIENQCWVIAAAQCGNHNPNRSSYGHSMVVDPWGKVVLDMGKTEEFSLGLVDINAEKFEA